MSKACFSNVPKKTPKSVGARTQPCLPLLRISNGYEELLLNIALALPEAKLSMALLSSSTNVSESKGRRTLYNFCCVGRCADGQQLLGVHAHYPITCNRSTHTTQQKLGPNSVRITAFVADLLKVNVGRPSGFKLVNLVVCYHGFHKPEKQTCRNKILID